jgi:hypothetical protein
MIACISPADIDLQVRPTLHTPTRYIYIVYI